MSPGYKGRIISSFGDLLREMTLDYVMLICVFDRAAYFCILRLLDFMLTTALVIREC